MRLGARIVDETMDALRKVEQTLLNGPERLDGFDEELFEHLVEKIIAESQNVSASGFTEAWS